MQCILVCVLKSLYHIKFGKIKCFMHHYNGDALIFRLTYSIKSLSVCGWSYEWVLLHIEPPS